MNNYWHFAGGALVGAVAGALVGIIPAFVTPLPAPKQGVTVDASRSRCGCPAKNAQGEPFSHCIRWHSDTEPVRHECGYTSRHLSTKEK